jgi:serine/threonine-protein kinase
MLSPLQPGEVLHDRYKIQRIIGQGGMGCIYLAEDLRLEGRQCAIKEVEYEGSMDQELLRQARDQFEREAIILARLDHPNLPKVSDFFSEGPRDYLVMDFVPGKDLRTLMAEARQAGTFLDERDVLGWADQIIAALSFMHSQDPPIFHRDIKPSNLKLTPSNLIKLVDFGLVKIQASEEQTITILQGRGTALYTPLEQYGGDTGHTDARSDIYAFGATLYHLLTNHPPIEARERFLRPDRMVLPRQLNPNLSYRTERAILWALSLHPDDRPQDMAALRKALFGSLDSGTQPRLPAQVPTIADLISSSPENILLAISVGLLIFSLIFTLFR